MLFYVKTFLSISKLQMVSPLIQKNGQNFAFLSANVTSEIGRVRACWSLPCQNMRPASVSVEHPYVQLTASTASTFEWH